MNTLKQEASREDLDRERREFTKWWTPQTKGDNGSSGSYALSSRGRFYGCSENWGAWQAWQQARLGKVYE